MRWAVSDLADWWDEQHKISNKALEDFVDAYPDWWVVAAVGATSMDLGAGMVDVLRFGEGIAEAREDSTALGIAKGVGKDVLRAVQIIGPVAKVAGTVVRAGARPGFALAAKLLRDPGGDICTWVSGAKALRQVGGRIFATVDDLAREIGYKLPSTELPAKWVNELTPVLRRFGARVRNLGSPTSWDDVVKATLDRKGVILFSVEWEIPNAITNVADKVGHTLYAWRDMLGRLRIADRTGNIVGSLAELETAVKGGYGSIGNATVYGTMSKVSGPLTGEMTKLEGVLMKILPGGKKAVLAMEILAGLKKIDSETAAQAFLVHKMTAGLSLPSSPNLSGPPPLPGAVWHTVAPGDWLSKIALKYYKNMHKWPVIYSVKENKKKIGPDPNLIKPNQVLLIPPLPAVPNANERAAK